MVQINFIFPIERMLNGYYNILFLVERELFLLQRYSRGFVSHNPAMNLLSSRNNTAYLFAERKSMRFYPAFQALII